MFVFFKSCFETATCRSMAACRTENHRESVHFDFLYFGLLHERSATKRVFILESVAIQIPSDSEPNFLMFPILSSIAHMWMWLEFCGKLTLTQSISQIPLFARSRPPLYVQSESDVPCQVGASSTYFPTYTFMVHLHQIYKFHDIRAFLQDGTCSVTQLRIFDRAKYLLPCYCISITCTHIPLLSLLLAPRQNI